MIIRICLKYVYYIYRNDFCVPGPYLIFSKAMYSLALKMYMKYFASNPKR